MGEGPQGRKLRFPKARLTSGSAEGIPGSRENHLLLGTERDRPCVFRSRVFPEISFIWLAVICHFHKLLNHITGVNSFKAYIFLLVISLVDLVTIKSEMVNPELPFWVRIYDKNNVLVPKQNHACMVIWHLKFMHFLLSKEQKVLL